MVVGGRGVSTSRPWDGMVVPSPAAVPQRSPGSPFIGHLLLDLVGAAPGAPGRYPAAPQPP